jgi:hypothetical protein
MNIVPVLAAVLVVAACGDATGGASDASGAGLTPPAARPTVVPAADGPVTTDRPVTVLDDGHGAQLCLGGQLDSYPPQCGGPRLVGWDWVEHEGAFEQANGVRWGAFVVSGAFDGSSLTPSEAVPAAEATDVPAYEAPDFSTPCPEPEGGWVVDRDRLDHADMERTFARAQRLDGYAFSYVDTSRDARSLEEVDQAAAAGDQDASSWVVNVRVTGDLAVAEGVLRRTWGGALCVLRAEHTDAELEKVQRTLNGVPGVLSSGRGQDRVDLVVVHDDGRIQAWADAEYGKGTVVVTSALVPA